MTPMTDRETPMNPMNEWNLKAIEEFRANGGKLGGHFEGAPLLLLHHVGARSGKERVTPMMYQDLGGGAVAVFATLAGAPNNPAWFHNVIAHPEVTVEIGTETRSFHARVTTGDERDRIWTAQKAAYPSFAEYETRTDRVFPVIVLDPA